MRLIIYLSPSYRGRVNAVHPHDADVRNGYHANVSDNISTCAYAPYHDSQHGEDDTVLQTFHVYTHCAAAVYSYNHTGYNHMTYNTMHNSHNYDCYSIRHCVHDHSHDHVRD